MKLLQIVPREGARLYGAMVKKQAEIRKSGRGTFSRAGAARRKRAKWTHVRYKGTIDLERGLSEAVEVAGSSRRSAATRRGFILVPRLALTGIFGDRTLVGEYSVSHSGG